MNTFQNLIDNGIEPHTAQDMLDGYSKRIGTMNGVYEITDITYDFTERGKDITLKCSMCGREIHRMMISGRNKWSELIKSCPCQKEAAKQEKLKQEKLLSEKIAKEKKDLILSGIGQIHGDYEIISVKNLENNPQYVLRCTECGAERKVSAERFDRMSNFHCSKHYKAIKFDESYIGRKKNFLKVIGISRLPHNNHRAFVCECDCGNIKLIEPAQWEQELVKSCGCKHDELLSEANKKENPVTGMRLYHVYEGMKDRCYNPNSDNYKYYGDRGIIICPEWLGEHGFESFATWAYSTGYDENAERGECTIERKDVNGNYEPNNCEWKTVQEQQKNKRTNIFITINGETKILQDWCKIYNVSSSMVLYRLKTKKMTPIEAFTAPITRGKNAVRINKNNIIELRERGMTYKQIADFLNCSVETIRRRIGKKK